jgi:DNA-binding response OmpR family regulator
MTMKRQQRILVVDDEPTLRDVVRRYLELDGFAACEAATGLEALDLLRASAFDLILLDIMLPGFDGFTITRALRHRREFQTLQGDVPIIMLTSRGDEVDRITGFELGIDDYVVKPFSPRELVARVKAVLRRSNSGETPEQALAFGALYIDPMRRVVQLGDEPLELTAKEFDLLWLFARHPQQVLTRDQLINQVWGYEYDGDDSTVTVHIRRLREKIEHNPSQPAYLHTVRGVGYKFDPS